MVDEYRSMDEFDEFDELDDEHVLDAEEDVFGYFSFAFFFKSQFKYTNYYFSLELK